MPARLSNVQRLVIVAAAVLAGGLVAAVGFAVDSLEQRRYQETRRALVAEALGGVRARLEQALDANMMVIGGLAALAKTCPDCGQAEFDRFARNMAEGHDDIRSLQLAPDAVVTYVWPRAGNEAAIGMDLRRMPGQSATVERTIREGRFVLAGPLDLRQGGVGLVGRKPVYLRDPAAEDGRRFWGFATMVLDFRKVLVEAGWDEAPGDLQLALRGRDGLGDAGGAFLGRDSVFGADPVTDRVAFPNGNWQIAAVPKGGWDAPRADAGVLRLAVLLLAGLAALGAAVLARALIGERRARRALERASQAKSCFFARMSHELRTPLNAINGFAYVMMNQMLGPLGSDRYREYAEDIHRSGTHLLELVNTILDMQKVETGRFELVPEDLDVSQVVDETLRLLDLRADKAGVALVRDLPDDLPPLSADPRALRQMLINLLSNAVKYTGQGGEVRVTAALRDDGGMVLAVSDTGCGIPETDLEKALTPFGQVIDQGNRVEEGTGLGLPLTRSLVELHGGSLDLSSAVGIGTTVSLQFPAAAVAGNAARKSETAPEGAVAETA